MRVSRHDVVVGDDSGASIFDENLAKISNFESGIESYCNVYDNSCTPIVVDKSEIVFIDSGVEDESDIIDSVNEDLNDKKTDNNSNDGNSNHSSNSSNHDSNTQQTTDETLNCFDVWKYQELDQPPENEQQMTQLEEQIVKQKQQFEKKIHQCDNKSTNYKGFIVK